MKGDGVRALAADVERIASELKAACTEAVVDKLLVEIDKIQKEAAGIKATCAEASEKSMVENYSKELEEHMANCVVKKAALISEAGNNVLHDVQVACRIRPSKNGSEPSVIPVSRNQVSVKSGGVRGEGRGEGRGDRRKTFNYSEVFGPESTQDDVFDFVRPLIMSVLNGGKTCLCAYGQTGSGKSYTLTGMRSELGSQRGIFQYALDAIFNGMENDDPNLEVQIIQVCNETINDLLKGDLKQVPSIDKATRSPVKSVEEGVRLFEEALKNKATSVAKTGGKRVRAHQVMTVYVNKVKGEEGPGCLQLLDLSGSERVGRSEATVERLEEAKHINKSLSALGDVLGSMASKKGPLPLMENKLTETLQHSLLGSNSKAAMIVHIAPEDCFRGESLAALMFGQRVSIFKDGNEGKEKLFGARKAFSRMVANDPSNQDREVQMRIAARSAMSEKEDMEKDLKALRDELNLTRRSLRDMESRSLFRHVRSTSLVSRAEDGSDSSSRQSQQSGRGPIRTSRSSSLVSRGPVAENMARLNRPRRGIDRPYTSKGRRLSIAFEEPPDTPGSMSKQLKNVGPAEVR